MSDPIKKLEQTCSILGDKCKELVKKRNDNRIDDTSFIREYFNMLDNTPESKEKSKAIDSLKEFKTSQEEVSFSVNEDSEVIG